MSEADFSRQVQRRLKMMGAWVIKFHASQYTPSGVPDLLCCFGGHFVALELKLQKNTPTKIQQAVIAQIKQAGGYAVVVYPETLETTLKYLERMYGEKNEV